MCHYVMESKEENVETKKEAVVTSRRYAIRSSTGNLQNPWSGNFKQRVFNTHGGNALQLTLDINAHFERSLVLQYGSHGVELRINLIVMECTLLVFDMFDVQLQQCWYKRP